MGLLHSRDGLLSHFGASGAMTATCTVTTTGAAQTLTINSFGVSAETVVDWGDGQTNAYTGTALRTHVYASAGTYTVTINNPQNVTTFDIRDNKITLNSANIKRMVNVATFIATGLKAGTFNSADVSAWRPAFFYLHSMPAGYAFTIAANDFAAWTTTSNFQMQSNALTQAQVNALLWGMYQVSTAPRTVTGGTINVGGSNAAPSGTFQPPASCPVTSSTPGKEVAHALLNDGCAVGFNKWTTVTTS